ncbi:hypothetical protein B0H13DRAFT_2333016 [Mycena leptocephala]|nr:hypothetical protein B0H13DRAFT_2333016 [Mycena leptocephala]
MSPSRDNSDDGNSAEGDQQATPENDQVNLPVKRARGRPKGSTAKKPEVPAEASSSVTTRKRRNGDEETKADGSDNDDEPPKKRRRGRPPKPATPAAPDVEPKRRGRTKATKPAAATRSRRKIPLFSE